MTKISLIPNDPVLARFIAAVNNVAGGTDFGMKRTEEVFQRIVNSMASAWRRSLGPEYARTVKTKRNSPFSYEIYSNNKMVSWKEHGLESYDMKETHTKGVKSRIIKPRKRGGKTIESWTATRKDGTKYTVKAGSSYLIVPFRHGATKGSRFKGGRKTTTSGALATQLSDIINTLGKSDFARSTVKSSPQGSGRFEENALGEMIERAEYRWGDRLELPQTEENQDLQGMVAMDTGRGSQFMSFRIVSQNSSQGSWIHPGIKAENNLPRIAKMGQSQINESMEKAMKEDLGL